MSGMSNELYTSIHELVEDTIAEARKDMPKQEYAEKLFNVTQRHKAEIVKLNKTIEALQEANKLLFVEVKGHNRIIIKMGDDHRTTLGRCWEKEKKLKDALMEISKDECEDCGYDQWAKRDWVEYAGEVLEEL